MNIIIKQLTRIAKEVDSTNQLLRLNSELKVLQVTKDLQVKLKQDFNFGKINLQQSNRGMAKTDWSFKLSLFNKTLLQESKKLYDLAQGLKSQLGTNNNNHQKSVDNEGDLYDEQTGKFIGIQLSDRILKQFDWFLKQMKQSKVAKYMPQMIELFEQFKQQVEGLTKKYGEGKHGEKVKEQFNKIVDDMQPKYNYIINKMQKKYGKDLQKLSDKEQQQVIQFFEQFDTLLNY